MLGRGAERIGGPARHPLGRGEPVRVDVVEHDLRVAKLRVREEVAEQVAGELDAAGTDEHDPRHQVPPPDPDDVPEPLAVVALDPARTVGVLTPPAGEGEGEQRDGRDGGQRCVILGRGLGDRQQGGAGDGRARGDLDHPRSPAGGMGGDVQGRRPTGSVRGSAR